MRDTVKLRKATEEYRSACWDTIVTGVVLTPRTDVKLRSVTATRVVMFKDVDTMRIFAKGQAKGGKHISMSIGAAIACYSWDGKPAKAAPAKVKAAPVKPWSADIDSLRHEIVVLATRLDGLIKELS